MKFMFFSIKYCYTSFKPFGLLQSHLLYFDMVSVTSASRYITSESRYHPRYQSRSSMYVRGLIPLNFAGLADEVPIVSISCKNKNIL